MTIHALWCHPRSVSTAFERIMRERGDLTVLHEPFLYHYYLTQTGNLFPDFDPDPGHPQTYEDIRQMILNRAEQKPVFFKDMAFYVLSRLPEDADFVAATSHAFLVRDPAESILSYARRDPGFTLKEAGIEAQHQLYLALRGAGQVPLVITSDQLRDAPEATMRRYWAHVGLPFAQHAFSWDSKVPEGWQSVSQWHRSTLNSGTIQKRDATRDYSGEIKALGAPYTEYERHHRPFFEEFRKIAETQAHQK